MQMELGQAPSYGEFTFVYKGVSIHVPVGLNDVARYKPDSFWDWLLFKHSFDSYITLTLAHIIEENLT